MRRSQRRLLLTTTRTLQFACALALADAARGATVQPLAWYRLGDDDPGAVAGNIGNDPTLDHTANHFDLSRAGPPRYSDDVPPNVAASVVGADKLSMKFFNFTGPLDIPQPVDNFYYRLSPIPPPTATSTTSFALEAWVKSSPLGQGDSSGYTLIAYNGTPFSNGIGFFQHGKNYVVRIGSSFEKILAPASSNTWTHLAFARRGGTANAFYLDGMEEIDTTLAAQTAPTFGTGGGPFFVGGYGNPMSASPLPPRYLFNGLVDEVRLFTLSSTALTPSSDLLIAHVPRNLSWSGGSSAWDTSSGNWTDPAVGTSSSATWSNAAPDNAAFGSGASSANVSVAAGGVSVGKLSFDASGAGYSLGGAGTISIVAPMGDGVSAARSATIGAPVSLVNDQDWSVAAGQTVSLNAPVSGMGLSKSGAGTLSVGSAAMLGNASLNVDGGAVVVHPGRGVLLTNSLDVDAAAGAKLDLKDNDAIVHSDATNRSADVARLTARIKSGINLGGTMWAGSGITSSIAGNGSGNSAALGIMLNDYAAIGQPTGAVYTSFDGKPVGVNDVLIMYTSFGDADLSGTITSNDYFRIDTGFLGGRSGWVNGDFDYDGSVTASDYFLIDRAFLAQTTATAASAPLATAVPEPAALAAALAAAFAASTRVRRR